MTDRDIMQQALEALEAASDIVENYTRAGYEGEFNEAITALRERLAQPEQEPVGKFAQFTDGIWREVTDGSAGVPLYIAPPQRKPLIEPYDPYNPKPVEYQYHYPDGSWRCSNGEVINGMRPDCAQSLYALKDNT